MKKNLKNQLLNNSDINDIADIKNYINDIVNSMNNTIRTNEKENLFKNATFLLQELSCDNDFGRTEDVSVAATTLINFMAEYTGTYQSMATAEFNEFESREEENPHSEDEIEQLTRSALGTGKNPYEILHQLAFINKIVKSNNIEQNERQILYDIKANYIKKIIELLINDSRFANIDCSFYKTDDTEHPYLMIIDYHGLVDPIQVHFNEDLKEEIDRENKSRKPHRFVTEGGNHDLFIQNISSGQILGKINPNGMRNGVILIPEPQLSDSQYWKAQNSRAHAIIRTIDVGDDYVSETEISDPTEYKLMNAPDRTPIDRDTIKRRYEKFLTNVVLIDYDSKEFQEAGRIFDEEFDKVYGQGNGKNPKHYDPQHAIEEAFRRFLEEIKLREIEDRETRKELFETGMEWFKVFKYDHKSPDAKIIVTDAYERYRTARYGLGELRLRYSK